MIQRRDSKENRSLGPDGQPSSSERKGRELRASLYDDTLSEKKPKSPWISIGWGLLFIIVLVGVVLTLLNNSSKERIAELAEINRAEKENSLLAQKVREIREQSSIDETSPDTKESTPIETPSEVDEKSTPLSSSSASSSSNSSGPKVPEEPFQPEPEAPSFERAPERNQEPSASDISSVADDTREPLAAEAEPPPSVEEPKAEESEDSAPAEPAKNEGDLKAYQSLLESSRSAERLVSGDLATLAYQDWRVVQRTDSEVWIDLIANWTTGTSSEVHLIWAVNRENGTVRPLSDAARTLDSTE